MSVISNSKAAVELIESKRLIVLDFDGVLADSVEVKTNAFAELYRPYGANVVSRVVDHHRNNGGMSRYEKFRHYHKEFLGQMINDDMVDELSNAFSALVVEKVIAAPDIGGAKDFLNHYCNNDRVCVVNSATPTLEMHDIVKGRGLSGYFDAVYGSPNSKKDNLIDIAKRFSVSLNDGVFFGDAASDFNAANALGMDFIGIGSKIAELLSEAAGSWQVFDDLYGCLDGA